MIDTCCDHLRPHSPEHGGRWRVRFNYTHTEVGAYACGSAARAIKHGGWRIVVLCHACSPNQTPAPRLAEACRRDLLIGWENVGERAGVMADHIFQ